MAVQGIGRRLPVLPSRTLAFWLVALVAGSLSLAAALVGLTSHNNSSSAPAISAAADAQQREQRIAFFEARAAADAIDIVSLNVLAGEYLQRARITGDVADYDRAEYAATRSLDLVPTDNYSGLANLAAVRLVQHDYHAAATLANSAIALKPEEAAPYGSLGDAMTGLGRYDDAQQAYDKMVEIAGSLPALSRLATLAFIRGDTFNAVDYWKQAIATAKGLPPENLAWAHVQLGTVYYARGDYARAVKENEAALKVYPDFVHALAGLGAARAAQGRYDEAATLYERAVEKLPQPQYVAALGDVYAHLGRSADAESQYALVEAIDKLYRAANINTDLSLSLFYADHDRQLDRALVMAQAAYDAAPNVYAADALAWALYKNRRFDEAGAKSDEAMREGTPDPNFYYHSGVIAQALGQNGIARERLETALKLSPRFSVLHADDASNRLQELGR